MNLKNQILNDLNFLSKQNLIPYYACFSNGSTKLANLSYALVTNKQAHCELSTCQHGCWLAANLRCTPIFVNFT